MQKILFTKKLSRKELSILNDDFQIISENFIKINYNYPKEIPFSDNFILTSQNGVESLINLFSVEFLKNKNYFIVGEKTAQKLLHFTQNIKIIADDAEELAKKLIPLNENKFVHFCSDIHLTTLKTELEKENKKIQEIISYQTILNPKKIDDFFDAIVFFSPSGVNSFFKNNDLSEQTRIFALGKTTKDTILKFVTFNVHIPIKSNLKSLLELIHNEFTTKK